MTKGTRLVEHGSSPPVLESDTNADISSGSDEDDRVGIAAHEMAPSLLSVASSSTIRYSPRFDCVQRKFLGLQLCVLSVYFGYPELLYSCRSGSGDMCIHVSNHCYV